MGYVTLQKARETVPGNEIRIIGNLKHYAYVLSKNLRRAPQHAAHQNRVGHRPVPGQPPVTQQLPEQRLLFPAGFVVRIVVELVHIECNLRILNTRLLLHREGLSVTPQNEDHPPTMLQQINECILNDQMDARIVSSK